MNRRIVAMVISLAMIASFGTGCIGRSALGKQLFTWNLEVNQERWPREGIFFGLYALGVYPLAGLVDILVINSIEFWTGTNPISNESSLSPIAYKEFKTDDGTHVTMIHRTDDSIDVTLVAQTGEKHFITLTRTEDGVRAVDAHGAVLVDPSDARMTAVQGIM
jgi:hypothetical protein